jgi:hypothetical protein
MICFNNISPKINPKSYLKKRLEKLLTSFPKKEQSAVIGEFTEQPNTLPLLMPVDDGFEKNSHISETKNSFKEQYPLFDKETIWSEEILVCYTSKSFAEKGTFFIKQKTNFAEVYFQIPNITLTDGQVVSSSEIQKSLNADTNLKQIVTFIPVWALTLGKALGEKLLSTVGTMAWEKIRKDVLKQSDLPDYFQEVYGEIRSIVSFAFQEHYLKEVRDLAAKFELAINNYNNLGRNEADFIIVKNIGLDLITKSKSLGTSGNFHYAEAALLHIMTLQESYKRLVEKGAEANELQKARTFISDSAERLSADITRKHKELFDLRMSKISGEPFKYFPAVDSPVPIRNIGGVKGGAFDADGTFCYSLLGPMNMFKDEENMFWNSMYYDLKWEFNFGGFTAHSWNWVNKNLQTYRKEIEKETLESLKSLPEIADKLKQLSAKPIPDGQ